MIGWALQVAPECYSRRTACGSCVCEEWFCLVELVRRGAQAQRTSGQPESKGMCSAAPCLHWSLCGRTTAKPMNWQQCNVRRKGDGMLRQTALPFTAHGTVFVRSSCSVRELKSRRQFDDCFFVGNGWERHSLFLAKLTPHSGSLTTRGQTNNEGAAECYLRLCSARS